MDKTAFVIPKGLRFEQTSQGIIIEHEGDIVLQENIGSSIQRITSKKGDVHISVPLQTTEILAPRGKIFTEHQLIADRLEAQIIHSKSSLHVKEQILTSAVLRLDGDIDTPKLTANGSVSIGGSAKIQQLVVEGELNIAKDLQCDQLYCTDKVSISGDVKTNNIETKGFQFEVKGNTEANELIADLATVTLKGSSEIKLLRADSIQLQGTKHQIRAMQAKETISITGTEINADVLFCKRANLGEQTTGKIMVLETAHPPKPHRIKGCLQLSDLEGFLPNVDEFLQQRGINPSILSRLESSSETEPKEVNAALGNTKEKPQDDLPKEDIALALPSTEETIVAKIEPDIIEEDDSEESVGDHGPALVIMPKTVIAEELPTEEPPKEELPAEEPAEEDILSEEEILDEPFNEEPLEDFFTPMVNLDSENSENSENSDITILEDIAVELEEETIEEYNGQDPLLEEVRSDVQKILALYEQPPEALLSLSKLLDDGDLYYFRDNLQKTWRRVMNFHQVANIRYPDSLASLFNDLNVKMAGLD